MTNKSFYNAKKTYNVAALVMSHGQHVDIPADGAQGGGASEAAGESGDSSDKSVGDGGATPRLLDTPLLSLTSLETPPTKKHGRRWKERSIKQRHQIFLSQEAFTGPC